MPQTIVNRIIVRFLSARMVLCAVSGELWSSDGFYPHRLMQSCSTIQMEANQESLKEHLIDTIQFFANFIDLRIITSNDQILNTPVAQTVTFNLFRK
jgi:hypothetical protein